LLIEFVVVGWKRSSLYQATRLKRTNFWDLASVILDATGIQKILSNFFLLGFIGFLLLQTSDWEAAVFPGAPRWFRLILALVTFDFFLYWNHRLRHEFAWFWIVHEYHHSSTHVTMLTNFRVHPLDYLIFFPSSVLLMGVLFPGPILDLAAYTWLLIFPNFFAHSRIDTHLGWVGRYLIVTPRFHHLHHSRDRRKQKNYGHFLVIWDRLFGTYADPAPSIQEIETGLRENPYEGPHPIQAYFAPVLKFYRFPFAKLSRVLFAKKKTSSSWR
jgi:sterol desaturase/sphingolipid hydroxylase (fatty acid hydroxylase superfamily)